MKRSLLKKKLSVIPCWLHCTKRPFTWSARMVSKLSFLVRPENKVQVTALGSRCRQNRRFKAFGVVVWQIPSSQNMLQLNECCRLNVQHDYFTSFNQSYHWSVALSLPLQLLFLFLPILWCTTVAAGGEAATGNPYWPKHGGNIPSATQAKWRANWCSVQ